MIAADLGEAGIFGEESVARMDCVTARNQRRRNNVRNVEIRPACRARPHAKRFVGLANVERVGIGLGEDRDGRDAEFLTSAIDS